MCARPRSRKSGRQSVARAQGRKEAIGRHSLLAGVLLAFAGVPLAMNPWGYNPFGPPKAFLLSLAALLVSIGFVLDPAPVWAAGKRLQDSSIGQASIVLGGLFVVATATSVDVRQSIVGSYPEYQGVLALAGYCLIAIAAAVLSLDAQDRRWLGRSAAVALFIVSAYAIIQRLGLDPMHYRSERPIIERVSSTLGNASNLGVYLLLAVPLVALQLKTETRRLWTAMAFAACVGGALSLVWSYSRGAWLAALVIAGLLATLRVTRGGSRERLRWVAASVGVAVAAVVVGAMIWPAGLSRARSVLDPTRGTARWRVLVWRSSARMVLNRPLTGWGPATFRLAYPPFRARENVDGKAEVKSVDHAHNIVVNAAAVAGAPAGAVLLTLVGLTGWAAGSVLRRPEATWDTAAAASFVGATVALQFHFLTLDTGALYFAVIAVVAARSNDPPAPQPHGWKRRTPSEPSLETAGQPLARWLPGSAIVSVTLLACMASLGLLVADGAVAAGFEAVHRRSAWAEVEASLLKARRVAPWEPAFEWAVGQAARESLQGGFDPQALSAGERAMLEARRRTPLDVRAALQHADLVLTAALRTGDRDQFRRALGLYRSACAEDPHSALPWIGMGSASAGLGDLDTAIAHYRKAIDLAPRAEEAWSNLGVVCEAAGLAADARKARTIARSIRRGQAAPGSP